MKQLNILQDICLQVYGISLSDLDVRSFEHLEAVISAISAVHIYLNGVNKSYSNIEVYQYDESELCQNCRHGLDMCMCGNTEYKPLYGHCVNCARRVDIKSNIRCPYCFGSLTW